MEYLQKEFIPYDRALRLKKLGFDEPCFGCYNEKGVFGLTVMSIKQYYTNSIEDPWSCSAPTLSQTFRWFREKYGYLVGPFQNELDNLFFFEIGKLNSLTTEYYTPDCNTYEEAELACLDKLIEIVESKQKEDGG